MRKAFGIRVLNKRKFTFGKLVFLSVQQVSELFSLKVATYTSLNGGNRSSPNRLFNNATFNFAGTLGNVQTADLFLQTALCKAMQKTFDNFPVIHELKGVNKNCAITMNYGSAGRPPKYGCYTPDRMEMYTF